MGDSRQKYSDDEDEYRSLCKKYGEPFNDVYTDHHYWLKKLSKGEINQTFEEYKRTKAISKVLQRGITEEIVNVKMLLFSRWIAMNYGTPEYNVNGMDGEWWKTTLKYFNSEVYPTMILNGSVENTEKFLKE
jgi:hypothetical protein